jgi:hypothetical protein
MKRWLVLPMALFAVALLAQQSGVPPDAADDPCAPLPPELAGEAREEDDGLGRIGADGLPCPPLPEPLEPTAEQAAAAAAAQSRAKVEADLATAAEDENTPPPPPESAAGDFEPEEEISEDYPVPLPSDI